ncbi:MAG: PD40 domain-containing protein [Candidatus Latescibacteria bacterium]|nr:PD40 domain-containing protein [Candidatus Latescibacterota bacterium]
MKVRPDLVPETERDNLEVIQLTDEPIPSSHIYMEAQIFTPDSQRLILHRSAHPHGSDPKDPEHQFLICNLEDNCSLTPITTELGTTGPSISPDGAHLYYFVNETEFGGGGRLMLKRVGLDGSEREIIYVLDHAIPETDFRLSRPYPLSTISSDGGRIAISGFLGDGNSAGARWGLLVFEIEEPSVRLVLHGPTWCNLHPQYTRQMDPVASHDIMIQENHGNIIAADGRVEKLVSGLGADIHLIRDDGTDLRDFPWGRDGNEFCQGHQCWQGKSDIAITSTSTREPDERQLISGRAAAHVGDEGINTPGGWRNDLSRSFDGPDFWHFATDRDGIRLITDAGPKDGGGAVWLFDLPEEEDGALANARKVANPGSSWQKDTHIHPFLSPDGRSGFFNSDESGLLQAYMVRGWQMT